jgi:hypothetical protein
MVNVLTIEDLIADDRISRISDYEKPRYINFFNTIYKDDLELSRYVLEKHPRWSIISGYYAMHDITKLFLARNYGFKVNDIDVHGTTISLLSLVLRQSHEDLVSLFESGYEEYKNMAGELYGARNERRKAQYYTGSEFSRDYYLSRARKFYDEKVEPYSEKIIILSDAL